LKNYDLRRNNSGQVIVITALLVALLLLSSVIFVVETEKKVPTIGAGEYNVFSAYEQSIRNALISALANVTCGGDVKVLNNDLSDLTLAIIAHSYQNSLKIDYLPLNLAPYKDGLLISWDVNGHGVSSANVNFIFNSSGFSIASNIVTDVNVTSAVNLKGRYLQLGDALKQITLIINVQNENNPALAQNFDFYFKNETNWIKVVSPNISNFGNGTYSALFDVETGLSTDPVLVSMYCKDQRGITVGANVTCIST